MSSFYDTTKLIGRKKNTFIQSYITPCYKKSDTLCEAHLRIGKNPINLPYLIKEADFISCSFNLLAKNNTIIDKVKSGGTILINSEHSTKTIWKLLSSNQQYQIIEKNVNLLSVNELEIKELNSTYCNSISEKHACFLALESHFTSKNEFSSYKEYIYKVDKSINHNPNTITLDYDSNFNKTLLGNLLLNNEIPVSHLPSDGTYPTNTSKFDIHQKNKKTITWNPETCIQCGYCSMACPSSALRIKVYEDTFLNEKTVTFKHTNSNEFDLLNYTIQVNPEQCNTCNNCIDACPSTALTETDYIEEELDNWNRFQNIPELDRSKIDFENVSQQQLLEPLFKYANGDKGCGEMPYLKVMSQLFGDRLLIANATGSSSIFGGALPTTPWSVNSKGQGPAWSNSLFEDNAEFGLGYRLSVNQLEKQAKDLLKRLLPDLDFDLAYDILNAKQTEENEINEQRTRVNKLKKLLKKINSNDSKQLLNIIDNLIKKSVWIVGGDGWAYDIGFGGLDHVMASGENVNILILDNEVYDNTGGQVSKATPLGVKAKVAFNGKQKQKKDLGLLAMHYDNVYVASIAIGANQEQTLKAFNEAEKFEGPSIIIAYCHSSNHGINMKNPSKYHKAAVDSGQWLLYRNNPNRKKLNLNPFQLDSNKPSIKIEDYLKLECRFSNIINNAVTVSEMQKTINQRYNKLELISG